MQLDKPLVRACAIPGVISIAALAFGAFSGIATDPAHPTVAHANDLTRQRDERRDGGWLVLKQRMSMERAVATRTAEARKPAAPADPEPPVLSPHARAPAPMPEPPSVAPEAPALPAPALRHPSLFEDNTLVAFYGTPLAPGLGVLGLYPPEEMALRLKQQAAVYDQLNGDKSVIPAMDLIYSIVQDQPTANGLFLNYLPDDRVREYIALAERHDLQLILDLQIGRGDVSDEVRKVERFLLHPRVHVAVDPEYAVGPQGYPILTPGIISGHEINEAQGYLNALVEAHNLPPKMFVIHQFMDKTVIDGEVTASEEHVDLVLNMDAYGAKHEKEKKYRHFASRPYAEKRSFNIFLKQDEPVSTEQEVLQLDPVPDMVMYQ